MWTVDRCDSVNGSVVVNASLHQNVSLFLSSERWVHTVHQMAKDIDVRGCCVYANAVRGVVLQDGRIVRMLARGVAMAASA